MNNENTADWRIELEGHKWPKNVGQGGQQSWLYALAWVWSNCTEEAWQENDTIYRKKREINKKNQGDYGCGACRVVCGRVQWKWALIFKSRHGHWQSLLGCWRLQRMVGGMTWLFGVLDYWVISPAFWQLAQIWYPPDDQLCTGLVILPSLRGRSLAGSLHSLHVGQLPGICPIYLKHTWSNLLSCSEIHPEVYFLLSVYCPQCGHLLLSHLIT